MEAPSDRCEFICGESLAESEGQVEANRADESGKLGGGKDEIILPRASGKSMRARGKR
ncbi:MAG TPA: hypothetical protein VMP12_02565 [Candidatus Sulfotelmatobacter sp.]|nr:hypothetical protein [Candidatus Sulfotelmatobacter sp.]